MRVLHNHQAGEKTVKEHYFLVLVPQFKGSIIQMLIKSFGFVGGYFLFQKQYLQKLDGIHNGHDFESTQRPCSGMFMSLSFLQKSSLENIFSSHLLSLKKGQTLYLIIPRFFKKKKEILRRFLEIEQQMKITIFVVIGDKNKINEVIQMVD